MLYCLCMCVFCRACSEGTPRAVERPWLSVAAVYAKQSRRNLQQHGEVVRSTLPCRNEEVGYECASVALLL